MRKKNPSASEDWQSKHPNAYTVHFLPISFICPVCGQRVQATTKDGRRVGCGCIEVDYEGCRLDGVSGIIPAPSEIIPHWVAGKVIDFAPIIENASFLWGRLVARKKAKSDL
jgi:hypothetical protein